MVERGGSRMTSMTREKRKKVKGWWIIHEIGNITPKTKMFLTGIVPVTRGEE